MVYKIMIVVVSAAIVLSIASYFYFQSISQNIENTIKEELRQNSKNEAFHLGELLQHQVGFAASNALFAASSEVIKNGDIEHGSDLINLSQQQTSEITDGYFWINEDGKIVWSSVFTDPEEYRQYNGFDVTDRPYFSEVARTHEPFFSPLTKSLIDNTTHRFFFAYPILANGIEGQPIFKGVIVTSVRADALSHSIAAQLSPSFESSLGIVDTRGAVVYSQTTDLIGENIFGEKIQTLLLPAFQSQEKVDEFNNFLRTSIEEQNASTRDFSVTTGPSATISAVPIILSSQADEGHHLLTLYISTPHNVASIVGPLVADQRNYSLAVIGGIALSAVAFSMYIISSNRRLENAIRERTKELDEANQSLSKSNSELVARTKEVEDAYTQIKLHDKLQTEFINIAAHELRTPVQPILGAMEMLEDEIQEGNDNVTISKAEIEMITRNAKRLAKLTTDILEASRIESKTLKLRKEPLNLQQKIKNVIADVDSFIGPGKDVKIIFEPKISEPVVVQADKTALFEVIANLLRNSIKFTNQGIIKVTLEKDNDHATVTVLDPGRGIDPEIMPNLFKRFVSKSDSGTGLGLFIARNIIEAHGGTITGENNPTGGAIFRFTLPLKTINTANETQGQEGNGGQM